MSKEEIKEIVKQMFRDDEIIIKSETYRDRGSFKDKIRIVVYIDDSLIQSSDLDLYTISKYNAD